jgi:ABC-type nitrate/sulfonate/bicarbonate transport system substrate-binding protein
MTTLMQSEPTGSARHISLIVFPGGFNWPVWVAQDRGLFARHDIAVDVALTPGSVFQWTALARGDAQVAVTLMDNVVAYREDQGEAPVVVEDAVALMSLDTRSMPALVTAPGIRTYADLRGRTLAVDAVKTGNALVLIGMLEQGGLRPGDYRLEQAGGVMQRYEAMTRGDYAGSLFNAPFDGLLKDRGYHILDTADSILGHFQGQVVAVRKHWAELHRPVVVDFLRAITAAIQWLYAPGNRDEAFAIHDRNTAGAQPGAAATAYAVLFAASNGIPADGEIDVEGVTQVLALRAKYGQPPKPLHDPSGYCDDTFLAEAMDPGAERPISPSIDKRPLTREASG